MSEPRDWDLLARYLAGEASAEEVQEVQHWLASDTENRAMMEALRASFSVTAAEEDTSDLNVLWSKISEENGRSKYGITRERARGGLIEWLKRPFTLRPVPAFRLLLPVVAVLALLAVVWIPYQILWRSSPTIEVVAGLGEMRTVVLTDGTEVVLDAGSKLVYPEAFEGESRRVALQGEAYFNVATDSASPFVVTAAHGEITVLGTEFNLRSWDRQGPVEVIVAEGRVKFGQKGVSGERFVILTPGQASSLQRNADPSPPRTIDVARELAWLRDEVYSDDAPLAEILDRLRRWHNVEIVTADTTLLREHLTLHLTKSSLQVSLDLVAKLTGAQVTRIAGAYHLIPQPEESK